ncbi:MAG: AGE family epimerase/isomerase [Scrofimicrobium sp.]
MSSWIESVEHNRWLSRQMQALLEHGKAAVAPTGYGYFKSDGSLDTERPVDLAITARMTFAYSLGTLLGIPGCRRYCDHGIRSLQTYFKDRDKGGWFTAIEHEPNQDGTGTPWKDGGDRKWQYAHAFLILAASTAATANRPGATELLRDALANQEEHWWDEVVGAIADEYSRDWSECVPYRGMNSLLHTVEAYLAAAEAMQEPIWIARAGRMLERAYEESEKFDWRVPEHLDEEWNALPDYNKDAPNTPYYPYGAVVGHGLELARLGVEYRAALREHGLEENWDIQDGATRLFDRARADGWRRGGKPGFLYTTTLEGEPVLTEHLAWVVNEGICAAVSLRRAVLDDDGNAGDVELYDHCYRSWIDYLHDYMELEEGVFARVLDEDNQPISGTIPTRPDIYHPIQALLTPRLPLWPPIAPAISRGLLDKPAGAPPRLVKNRGRRGKAGTSPLFTWKQ